jgi:Family of unknown function (DUF6139)
MRVDLYRRPEPGNHFSYLAVPEGQPIPEEATNTDWVREAGGTEMGEDGQSLSDYGMPEPARQFKEKGYAMTSVTQLQG